MTRKRLIIGALLAVALLAGGALVVQAWAGVSITAAATCEASGATIHVFAHDDQAGDLAKVGSGNLSVTGPEASIAQWTFPASGDMIAMFVVHHRGTYKVVLAADRSVQTTVHVRDLDCHPKPTPSYPPSPSPSMSPSPSQTPSPAPSETPTPAPTQPPATPSPSPCEETPATGGDCSGVGKG